MKRFWADDVRCTRRDVLSGAAAATCTGLISSVFASGRLYGAAATNSKDDYRVVPGWPDKEYPSVQSRGIDTDKRGTVYVAGDADYPVLMVEPDGRFAGCWGKGLLKVPHGLRIHKDTVWVTDIETQTAHQFTPTGTLLRSFGEKGVAGDGPNQFNRPTDFAFGPDGAIYISDGYRNTRVVCRNPDGSVRKIWGEKGTGPGQFDLVHAIAIDAGGNVYVADRNNNRLQIFDLSGKYLKEWKHVGTPYGLFACADRTLFVCGLDAGGERFRVLHLDPSGKVLGEFGQTGDGPGQFLMAHSLCVTKSGEVIVADGKANRIQKFTN